MNTRVSRLALLAAILFASVGCDQATKAIATVSLSDAEPMSFLGDTLRIQYALNSGAFLSLGSRLPESVRPWLLISSSAIMVAVTMGVLLVRWNLPRIQYVALALISAGGIGNLIDRMTQNGHVTDFLNVGIGPIRTGIFNVADMALMAGTIVLCWRLGVRQPFLADSNAARSSRNAGQPQH